MTHLHDRASALVDGELGGGARRRALRHARHCRDCREEVSATFTLKRRLGSLSQVDPPGDLMAVLDSADPHSWPTPVGHPAPPAFAAQRILVGVGAMSVVLLVLAWYVGTPSTPSGKRVSPAVEEFAAEFSHSAGRTPLSVPVVAAAPAPASAPAKNAPVPRVGQDKPQAATADSEHRRSAADNRRAQALLTRAMRAPDRLVYHGVRQVRSFTDKHPSKVRTVVHHVPKQGTAIDAVDVPGSSPTETAAAFVTDGVIDNKRRDGVALRLLQKGYSLDIAGSAKALGRRATVITASGSGQIEAKFWVDNATGLLLRRQTFSDGKLVRSAGFVSLDTARHGFLQHLPPLPQTLRAESLPLKLAPALNDTAWACPDQLIGDFSLVSLRRVDTGRPDTVHASYSDGLSNVSVFEAHGTLDPTRLHGYDTVQYGKTTVYIRHGLPTIAVWQSAGTVFTVVTDATPEVAHRVIRALPHRSDAQEHGTLDRIGSGFTTMLSTVAP